MISKASAAVSLFAPRDGDDLSTHLHRILIGIVGLTLPLLLWLVAASRPTEGLSQWKLLGSISAYYYSGAVVIFVGSVVALAAFLITYRGYDNDDNLKDRIAGFIASVAAIGVAFFPTGAPEGVPEAFWWTAWMRTTHYVSAAVLFLTLTYFALFLFPKSKAKKGEALSSDKKQRNRFYRASGAIMLVCILWAGSSYFTGASIFWPESIALEAFAVSWLVKGRADWTLSAASKKTIYYGTHPGRLAGEILGALKSSGGVSK